MLFIGMPFRIQEAMLVGAQPFRANCRVLPSHDGLHILSTPTYHMEQVVWPRNVTGLRFGGFGGGITFRQSSFGETARKCFAIYPPVFLT
jgi:hypothetical protein